MPSAFLMGWDDTNKVWVKCIVTADGKLIINPEGFLENPPTEDEANKAPTSEWAFDHKADASAHHAKTVAGDLNHNDLSAISTDDHHTKYTDTESRAAIGDLLNSLGQLTTTFYCQYKRIERLNLFNVQYSGTSTHYASIKSTNNKSDIRIQGREIGVGYPKQQLRLWDGSAYQYAQTLPEVNALIATHTADASAHHAKYTDAEAVYAYYNRTAELTTGTYTAYDVTDLSYISLSTSGGNIDIKGLDNGTYGQMIFFSRLTSANTVTVYHNSGDAAAGDKIYTTTSADVTVSSYSTFYMIYIGGVWICSVIT